VTSVCIGIICVCIVASVCIVTSVCIGIIRVCIVASVCIVTSVCIRMAHFADDIWV
jgi:hypothetical protein